MNKEEFLNQVDKAWEVAETLPRGERFDKLCELVDKAYDPDMYSAYIRIFYDCEETTADIAEDLLDFGTIFEIVAYKVIYTDDFDTVVVALHEKTPKNY